MDFSIARTADLSDQELGEIIGVSRIMAWKYRTERAEPRDGTYGGVDLRDRCEVTVKILRALVAKRQLPKPELAVKRNMDPELAAKRAAIISKIRALVDQHIVDARANT